MVAKSDKPRAITYIDGFNLYYGALKRDNTDLKWLDVHRLATNLLPGHSLLRVHYCTARIAPRDGDHGPSERQGHYLDALASSPGDVQIHEGNFQVTNKRMYRATPASCGVCDPRYVEVVKTEEKGSDVNLAVQLVEDAVLGRMDVALVISGDSDIQMAVDIATSHGIEVVVVDPRNRRQTPLRGARRLSLRRKSLQASQLPNTVQRPDGSSVYKPASWQ